MDKDRCKEALVKMALSMPQNVSGYVRELARVVDTNQSSAATIVDAVAALKRNGVEVDEFVAAYTSAPAA